MAERCWRVLVVDDNEIIRQLMRINLELDGFEVHQAADGHEALRRAGDMQPDVVVLDVMMPDLDGLEVARRLRAAEATHDIRLVLVSAKAQAGDVRRGEEAGVDAYITKPFEPEHLSNVVRRLAAAVPEGS